MNHQILKRPVLLEPNNFASLNQTPWAGTQLAQGLKKSFALPNGAIGESWEFSCAEEKPSQIQGHPELTLPSLIRSAPQESLGSLEQELSPILVKLINASSPLSLQIHPSDSHPLLKENESGKPESWLVLDAKPGSGLYLGFSQLLKLSELETHLKNGTFDANWLQFIPVAVGDFFEIEPGVPHAIGPGVVLLEPQTVKPGRSGKTWRMWDWNRRYNTSGQEDENGKPRELHIEESLTLISPNKQTGPKYATSLRRAPKVQNLASATVYTYPANKDYQVLRVVLKPNGAVYISKGSKYGVITGIRGKTSLRSNAGSVALPVGQTAFLPFAALPVEVKASGEGCEWTIVIPSGAVNVVNA